MLPEGIAMDAAQERPSTRVEGAFGRRKTRGPARWKFLAQASVVLEESLDVHATLAKVASMAVPVMADFVAIQLKAEDGGVAWGSAAHRDPAKATLAARFAMYAPRGLRAPHPVLRAMARGEARLVRDVDETLIRAIAQDADHLALLHELAPVSLLVVPMQARGRTFGSMVMVTTRVSNRRYLPSDVAIARETARRAALAVDHARMFTAAERAARGREAVLAMVSHDLKNPLSTIMMASQLLLEELVPADAAHSVERIQLSAIRRSANRMRRLVGDLLDASALEAGRLHVAFASHPLAQLLEEVRDVLQPLASEKGVRLDIAPCEHVQELNVDRERLLQVFANLGGNAIKFTPLGGCVSISGTTTDSIAVFEVSDTGPGISPDDIPHIFDRFWQAHETARLGTGLGLTIAKGIVESHGGRIEAISAQGSGSTFRFTIPANVGRVPSGTNRE
jgi:signal transduction histidine kinase